MLVYSPTAENLTVLREACFKYFELGGECVDGPISLLSIVRPNVCDAGNLQRNGR